MAEEIKNEEVKKVTFKEKVKKILPWVLGGIGTVGGSILAFKFGKNMAKVEQEFRDENVINRYLLDRVDDLKDGEHVAVCVMDENDKETYAVLNLVDEKPEWFDDSYEVTTESYFSNLVTSVSTKK